MIKSGFKPVIDKSYKMAAISGNKVNTEQCPDVYIFLCARRCTDDKIKHS